MNARANRILLLGGSRYTLRSIRAARELGFEVVVVDRDPAAEGLRHADYGEAVDITDVDGVIAVARRYEVQGVVALSDFGVRAAAEAADALGLVGLSRDVALRATSKYWMRRLWDECGVPSAAWRLVTSVEQAHAAVDDLNRWPLILKPDDSRGGGSRGVSVVNSRREVAAAYEFARASYGADRVLVEEFLEGLEHSVETFTFDGVTHVLAVSDKIKSPLPYRVDASVIYPTILEGDALARVHETCARAVRAIGITVGPAHVELCTTASGPRLFELGARCGGGATPDPIIPFVTGVEQLKETIRVAAGGPPRQLQPVRTQGCVYRFLSPAPGAVSDVSGVEEVRRWPGILDCAVTVGPGDVVRPLRAVIDRAGFLIAGGPTRAAALQLADAAEAHIQFRYR